MPELTEEEVKRQLFAAKSWKAPGEDDLLTGVWQQVWPAVKGRVMKLFRASLTTGQILSQWRNAKIILLKKPRKEDYTKAKAWRPISLLTTLGKVLKSVVAERISHTVKTYGLLPTNHMRAWKKRSAEQALILLQEHIYKAWRSRKVLSLVSFDVKGAYNGVHKDRLLQRLQAREIPWLYVNWIDTFCSNRTATLQVNRYTSEHKTLLQSGLLQGSSLSLILFLFFNADLVQRTLNGNEGSIAFVDDYTAWVTGASARFNQNEIQGIINDALQWEKRSEATFKGEKTTIVHFTRNNNLYNSTAFVIKGERVKPKQDVKILGLIMDSKLNYKKHIAERASKSLQAAMALRRLWAISPATARQLFEATVAPVINYASNVWMHTCSKKTLVNMNRAQKIGA